MIKVTKAKKVKEQRRGIRHNWDALKLEFMQGSWDTVSKFRRDKGLPALKQSPYFTLKTKGWSNEKRQIIALAARKAAENLLQRKVEEIQQVRNRQSKLAHKLQDKGEDALKLLKPRDIEEARKLIATGMQEERAALGISGKGGARSLTQVNVNLPKTRFDELLENEDFEGILQLAAEVRRERARRTGEGIVVEGETETQ